jgi:hypothetical protein
VDDIALHEEGISTMGIRDRRPDPSGVFATGLLTGREEARIGPAMTAAIEAYADLGKVKSFWR